MLVQKKRALYKKPWLNGQGFTQLNKCVPFNLFAVPLEQLVGIEPLPAKRGPTSTLQRQTEQISSLSKSKHKFITEMLDALIKQQAG